MVAIYLRRRQRKRLGFSLEAGTRVELGLGITLLFFAAGAGHAGGLSGNGVLAGWQSAAFEEFHRAYSLRQRRRLGWCRARSSQQLEPHTRPHRAGAIPGRSRLEQGG